MLTFSEAVRAADGGNFDSNDLTIESPDNTVLDLTGATFTLSADKKTLTIKLIEANATLATGNLITVTPTPDAITDLAGNSLADTEVVGTTQIADG